jgi:hypothetical protein
MKKSTPIETIEKMSKLDTIPFKTFKELIASGAITKTCNLKKERTIFFDNETEMFIYFNGYHKALVKCGYFSDNEKEANNE